MALALRPRCAARSRAVQLAISNAQSLLKARGGEGEQTRSEKSVRESPFSHDERDQSNCKLAGTARAASFASCSRRLVWETRLVWQRECNARTSEAREPN